MKDGRVWLECDMVDNKNPSTAMFWVDDNTVIAVPLQDVAMITFYERKRVDKSGHCAK
jgi:hypothetical protein